jgi:hypothetical protein
MSHVSFVDSKTGEWIQCFETRQGVRCYVRDWATGRFVRMVRNLYLVYAVSYVYCKRRSPSSNIIYRLVVSIRWNWRDIALHRTITSFLDTMDRVSNIVTNEMMSRVLVMTQGLISAEYIGVEHTTQEVRSIEDICRCYGTGDERFVYTLEAVLELEKLSALGRCKRYASTCAWLELLESTVRPLLGAFSEVTYPEWCRQV